MVLLPLGSIVEASCVTLERSASTEPSWTHRMIAFGLLMCCSEMAWMFSRVSEAMSVVTVCGGGEGGGVMGAERRVEWRGEGVIECKVVGGGCDGG